MSDTIRTLFAEVIDKYHNAEREIIWECYPRQEHKERLTELTAEIEAYKVKLEGLLKQPPLQVDSQKQWDAQAIDDAFDQAA